MGKQSYSWYLGSGLIHIYLSLYFPFKFFMTILQKINVQLKEKKKDQGDFPDNNRIMVLMVRPLAFMTALLQREKVRNKTERKPIPKPTLTIKQIRILREVMFPM
jgi:hypothetical protein